MTSRRLWFALTSFAILFLLSLPLTAHIPGSDFQVRHVVWLALMALAVKTGIAWMGSDRG
jgi:hypothetical protein